jgi:hypothetical protein
LSPVARGWARHKFYRIADHFAAAADNGDGNIGNIGGNIGGDIGGDIGGGSSRPRYNRSLLIRLTYDHARSPLSQDNFLRAFFGSLGLSLDGDEEALDERVEAEFFGFADYLFDNFFLPRKCYIALHTSIPLSLTPSIS